MNAVRQGSTRRVSFYDHALEYYELKAPIDEAISAVLASGMYMGGQQTAAFEDEFAAWLGARHCVATGTCRDALERALRALGVGPGDEVISVSNTCIGGTVPITRLGGSIRWVDIDERSYNIDPQRLAESIGQRTKAIVVTHMYGHAADMDPILRVAGKQGLRVVEDAALAAGATYRGRKVGTLGDIGCFSHAPSKMLGTAGSGGTAVTDDDSLAARMRAQSTNDSRSPLFYASQSGQQILSGHRYEHEGDHSRISEISAATLRVKLPFLDKWIEARRDVANAYSRGLQDLGLGLPSEADYARHVYKSYTIRTPMRDELRAALAESGVETAVQYYPPLHKQPVYERYRGTAGCLNTTETVGPEIMNLPIYPQMTGSTIEYVCDATREYLRGCRR